MKWDEYKDREISNAYYPNTIQTTVECPKCGKHIYMRTNIILTSEPPQYVYFCECGWSGYSTSKWIIHYKE